MDKKREIFATNSLCRKSTLILRKKPQRDDFGDNTFRSFGLKGTALEGHNHQKRSPGPIFLLHRFPVQFVKKAAITTFDIFF